MARPRLPLALLTLAAAAWTASARAETLAAPRAAASFLDPFVGGKDARRTGGPGVLGASGRARTVALDPVKTDQTKADQAPSAAPSPVDPPSKTATPAQPAAPAAIACHDDSECPDENICENAACRRIQQRVNVLYLYYQEGTFREALGLYWSKRGPTGYNVLAPIYWNYFSPTSRSRVVAPFYWHFEDDAAHRTSTVIVPGLPISWSREPGASSFGIWPFFYKSTKFGWAAPLLGTFKIADPDAHVSFGAVTFLYWWSRGRDDASDLLIPIFFSKRSPASALGFALPLNFYWRNGTDSHLLSIPFFLEHGWKTGASAYSLLGYAKREGEDKSGSLLWLYWAGRNDRNGHAYDVLFPLLWSFRSRSSGTSLFIPLVWDFYGSDSRTTVVPPIVHIRRGSSWFNTLFPVFWSGGDTESDWRFQLLLPLFFWKSADHGARFSWLTPLGGYSRDDQEHSRTLFLLPAPYLYRRDSVRAIDIVTPLFIRHHNHAADATTRLIGLLLYLRDDPGGSTRVLFPLFWRFHDTTNDASATAVFPIFFHRSGPRDSATFAGVFPFIGVYHRSLADGGWSAGLYPLAFFGRRGDASHAVIFPLFWHLANAKGSTTALLPLFVLNRDRDGYDAAIVPALTFFGRHDARSYQVQFPLYWRFADDRAGTSTTVTPLGFFSRTPDGWQAGVGPLLPIVWAAGGGPRRHLVVFPLLWHFADDRADSSTTVVANVLHRRHGGETTDAFFPLFYYRRGARPGGADETSLTIFPLVHYRRDANVSLLVTPLYASVTGPRRAGGFLGPYFWYRGPLYSARGIPGLFADITRADTGERTRQWGPVFAIDAPGRAARVVIPLFGRYHDANETDTYVFPTFFRQRRTDGYQVDAFLPLFWHSEGLGGATTVVGPWYDHTRPDVHDTGFAPIYFWAKNPTRTLLVIPPLLTFHRRDFAASTSVTLAGPYYHHEAPDQHTTVIFPFWWTSHDGKRSREAFAPFYWHVEDGVQKSSWTLITPLYWSTHGTTRLRALLPIAWYSRDDATQVGTEGMFPLFYAAHGPARFTLYTLLAGWSRTPDTSRWYVGPIYASDTVESSTRVLFPLYVSHLDRKTETRTRLILPLLYFTRGNPEKSLTTWALLFWRRTDVSSATTLALPLFIDVHDYRQSRTTVLLPLFVRHANEVTGESLWMAPLVYRHVTATDTTNVVFPLYWDFKHEERRTTVLFPLYAHWTRSSYVGTYVFPIVYYRSGRLSGEPDGTWRLFVPPLFDAAVDRPGDFRWEVLGGLFGKERIGRNHYLKLFFFTIETKKASAVQTSWYGQPHQPSRAHPVRSLATNAW